MGIQDTKAIVLIYRRELLTGFANTPKLTVPVLYSLFQMPKFNINPDGAILKRGRVKFCSWHEVHKRSIRFNCL